MALSTEIISDPTVFAKLEHEWEELLTRAAINQVFMTPTFLRTWWETLGMGELQVIVVKDGEKLVGVAPLALLENEDNQRQLCFVGCKDVSDYLDIICDKDHQDEVYAAIADALTNQIQWDDCELCSIPNLSPARRQLPEQMPHFSVTERVQDVCPIIDLHDNWDSYLESLERKQRHEIRRKLRKIDEVSHQFRLVEREEELATAVPEFIRLHKASSTEKKRFWDEHHIKFFTQLLTEFAKKGWLKLYFLEIDGVNYSTMLVFDYANQFFLYNSGFNPTAYRDLSTGTVLTAYTIQQAIELGRSRYDFLRGDEEYKFRFGAVSEEVWDLQIAKH